MLGSHARAPARPRCRGSDDRHAPVARKGEPADRGADARGTPPRQIAIGMLNDVQCGYPVLMHLRLRRRPVSRPRIAVVESPLLLPPSGALGGVELAVVIGVDLRKLLAGAAVTVACRQPGHPVVIGLGLFEPRLLSGRQIGGG